MDSSRMVADRSKPVKKIRLLGKTWYRRGFPYWTRRVGLSVAYLIMLACTGGFVAGVLIGVATNMSGIGRLVVLVLIVSAIVMSGVTAFRSIQRTPEEKEAGRPMAFRAKPKASRMKIGAVSGSGLGLGIGAYGGSAVAGAFVAVGSIFVIGWALVFFVISLQRYLSVEEYEAVRDFGGRASGRGIL